MSAHGDELMREEATGDGAPRASARFAPTHDFAHCCPECGSILLYSDGRLICADRTCSRWGRST